MTTYQIYCCSCFLITLFRVCLHCTPTHRRIHSWKHKKGSELKVRFGATCSEINERKSHPKYHPNPCRMRTMKRVHQFLKRLFTGVYVCAWNERIHGLRIIPIKLHFLLYFLNSKQKKKESNISSWFRPLTYIWIFTWYCSYLQPALLPAPPSPPHPLATDDGQALTVYDYAWKHRHNVKSSRSHTTNRT